MLLSQIKIRHNERCVEFAHPPFDGKALECRTNHVSFKTFNSGLKQKKGMFLRPAIGGFRETVCAHFRSQVTSERTEANQINNYD